MLLLPGMWSGHGHNYSRLLLKPQDEDFSVILGTAQATPNTKILEWSGIPRCTLILTGTRDCYLDKRKAVVE